MYTVLESIVFFFVERVYAMSITNPAPVQGSLFPDDEQNQFLSSGNKQNVHVVHTSVEAVEDFHDEGLPWAQQGEGLL